MSSFTNISPKFLILATLLTAAFSFSTGTMFGIILLSNMGPYPRMYPSCISTMISNDDANELQLINPTSINGQEFIDLGGIHPSSSYDEAPYHEALVHPSMLTHGNPKRVAIVGGEAESILHEVLKHSTVEEVVTVGICEDIAKTPSWSNSTDIWRSGTESYFDDLGTNFDVIIIDTLRQDMFGANARVQDYLTVDSLFDKLSNEGVLVVQLREVSSFRDKEYMIETLRTAGFKSMHIYDECHGRFRSPRSYIVSLKSYKSRARWYLTTAEIELELHQRLHSTNTGRSSSLRYFDASTMARYQVPSKAHEHAYCQKADTPAECQKYLGIGSNIVPISLLEARKSTVGEYAGRGLFTSRDIPKGSTFDIGLCAKAFHVMPLTWSIIEHLYEWADDYDTFVQKGLESLVTFVEGYGMADTFLGKTHFTIDAGILMFCNHGCYGTSNYGDSVKFVEMTVDLDHAPEEVLSGAPDAYSPVFERHLRQILESGDTTTRSIKQGEEILCDYLTYIGNPNDWAEEVTSLRGICAGKTMGDISEYEFEVEEATMISSNKKSTAYI